MKEQSIFVTVLSWVLYQIGDKVSLIGHKWDTHFFWWVYHKVMVWSFELDKAGKVWEFVDEEEESS